MNTLLLIDGNAIMHRAYHALPPFKTKDGTPTNVIYGFISMLYRVITDFNPYYVVACFDTPKETFRNKLYKDYQAQRPKIDDNFIIQIPLVKQALDAAGIYHLEKDGFEADDLIGTISKIYKSNDSRVIILTGDKDILQLVNDKVFVAAPQLGLSNIKIYDEVEVERKLEVKPNQIPEYKALAGDQSDNYKGATGIGPKTASRLIQEFQTVENIYKNIEQIKSEKVKTILISEKENVLLSRKLAEIKCDVEISLDIKKSEFKSFNTDLKSFLEKYEITSLIKRVFNEKPVIKKPPEKEKADQIGLF